MTRVLQRLEGRARCRERRRTAASLVDGVERRQGDDRVFRISQAGLHNNPLAYVVRHRSATGNVRLRRRERIDARDAFASDAIARRDEPRKR
eukprot:101740-Pleurochrysis_carterae.AAC.1